MSVYDDDTHLRDMFESGAKGYLLKNTDQEEIERAIKTVQSGEHYYAKTLADNMVKRLVTQRRESNSVSAMLTPREKELMYYLWLELSSKQMADKMFVAPKTIDVYRSRLMEKTGCKNSVSLVKYALQHGIIQEWQASQR